MRYTTIAFNAKTRILQVKYQTPNADGDGWVMHEHRGKFEPGDEFRERLTDLDSVCSNTHEVITLAGSFTPEETPQTGRVRALPWAVHPVVARKVHFFRKEQSLLVQVMITGYRAISGGGFSLPGVKRYLHPGTDEDVDDLYLSKNQSLIVEALQVATTATLPRFIAHLEGKDPALQGSLPLDQGNGLRQTITLPPPEESQAFFDDEARDQAVALADTLTDFQRKILLEIRNDRDAGNAVPEAHSFKANRKKAVVALEARRMLRNGQGRLHFTEDGWNVSEVLRLAAAEEARR